MITETGGSDNYRNTRVKSFPKWVGQTISEKVGQILAKYSRTLHRYRINSAFLQPISDPFQILGKATKPPYVHRVSV